MNLRRHLSPSNALAFAALFIALGAGAYAAGLGKGSVKSKQIKDGAVATKDLKANAVDGSKVANGSLAGVDFADDSLTGTDIDESTLQGVVAADAGRIGPLDVKEIDFRTPINNTVTNLVTFPNVFRIDAQCANFGDGLDIAAFTAIPNSRISMFAIRATGGDDNNNTNDIRGSEDNVFNPNEGFPIDNNFFAGFFNAVELEFSTPAGFTATVDLFAVEQGNNCSVTGTAIGG